MRGVVGGHRGLPDVALSASFSGASLTFESLPGTPGTWKLAAGTSVATPYLAGIVAIADQAVHARLGLLNPALYRLAQARAPGIIGVTRGSNTVSFAQGRKTMTVGGYQARRGYNLVTGVGTIDAAAFIRDLGALRRRRAGRLGTMTEGGRHAGRDTVSGPAAFADPAALRGCWHPVAFSHDLTDQPAHADLLGEPLVLWRGADGRPRANSDLCVHRGTALSLGWITRG